MVATAGLAPKIPARATPRYITGLAAANNTYACKRVVVERLSPVGSVLREKCRNGESKVAKP